jgi:hypothetical protein
MRSSGNSSRIGFLLSLTVLYLGSAACFWTDSLFVPSVYDQCKPAKKFICVPDPEICPADAIRILVKDGKAIDGCTRTSPTTCEGECFACAGDTVTGQFCIYTGDDDDECEPTTRFKGVPCGAEYKANCVSSPTSKGIELCCPATTASTATGKTCTMHSCVR